LEVLHSTLGLLKSSPLTSLLQVLGKSLVFFPFLASVGVPSAVTNCPSSGILLLAWSLGDGVRFLYYVNDVNGPENKAITWLRYSAWIVLYPIGISCEAWTLWLNIPGLKSSGRFQIPLPNRLNMSFDPVSLIYIYLFVILPLGSFKMLSYMASQRRKALSKTEGKRD